LFRAQEEFLPRPISLIFKSLLDHNGCGARWNIERTAGRLAVGLLWRCYNKFACIRHVDLSGMSTLAVIATSELGLTTTTARLPLAAAKTE
jgi:hypothetical protein